MTDSQVPRTSLPELPQQPDAYAILEELKATLMQAYLQATKFQLLWCAAPRIEHEAYGRGIKSLLDEIESKIHSVPASEG